MPNGVKQAAGKAYKALFVEQPKSMLPDPKESAEVSKARGKAAAGIKDASKRRDYIARQGKLETYGGGLEPILRRTFLEHGKSKKSHSSLDQ